MRANPGNPVNSSLSCHPTPDAGTALVRALTAASVAAGCPARISIAAASPYRSATFDGMQLRLTLAAPVTRTLDQWLAALPDMEIAMACHVVAGIFVAQDMRSGGQAQAGIEALVLVRD